MNVCNLPCYLLYIFWIIGKICTLVVNLANDWAYMRVLFMSKPVIPGPNPAGSKKKKKTTLFCGVLFPFNFKLFESRDNPPACASKSIYDCVFLPTDYVLRPKRSFSALLFQDLSQWLIQACQGACERMNSEWVSEWINETQVTWSPEKQYTIMNQQAFDKYAS